MPQNIQFPSLIEQLSDLGYRRIVCEGGSELLEQLISAQIIDELDITFSNVTIGTKAQETELTRAIANWPNRITAKLGQERVARIKR